ncbi:DUF2992 family protein [Clostridium sp. BJN0013]
MNIVRSKFTVFFDECFWIGVCERVVDEKLEVASLMFVMGGF